ncbi:MAG: efflux RND transporter periplasmic adaptor subunit [Candidatus Nealsonbacteria bacterium]|nr:efflux RND transporter periplasmic adaptor subunit [Candidatus Nealsonbacteria bacterium]
MTLSERTWQRPVLILAGIGLVVAVGYFLIGGERLKAFVAGATPDHAESDDSTAHGGGHAGHGHGGGEPTVAVTLWADQVDIFLERPYPVAGKPVEMLAHVTVIENGSAVTAGSVTFEATGPAQGVVEVRVDKPARPGIFIPEVTFPKPGVYDARLHVVSKQIEGGRETIELPSVAVYANAAAAAAAAKDAEEDEPADEISFLKEQQWPIGLLTVEAKEQELIERLVVPGRVIVAPGAGAAVTSQISGIVSPPASERFPRVGEQVRQGQILAVVEPSIAGAEAVQLIANHAQLQTLDADLAVKQLDIETKIDGAKLTLAQAQDVYDRNQSLSEKGITAGKDLLLAKHELAQAQSRLDGLRQTVLPYAEARQRLATVLDRLQAPNNADNQRDELRVVLTSPIAGTVMEANATAGERITGDRQLFRLANLETVWIEADVSEYDLARVEGAPGASYRLAAYPDDVVPILDGVGRLIDVGAEVDPDTRTVPIRYEVANRDGRLRLGMFADLLIETDRRGQALAVPKEAVIDEGGETVVYVQTGGESFQRQRVELGIRDADLVEVSDGLQPGQRVATRGAYAVRLSTLSSSLPAHGHAH